jgi:branched-subunit amino acid transport protein
MDADIDWYVLGAILLLTLSSFLMRSGYFLLGDRFPLTENVRRALRYAPVAALTAIVVPTLAPWEQGAQAFYGVPMLAAAAAVLIYARTRNTVLLIAGGMAAFWLLRWLL